MTTRRIGSRLLSLGFALLGLSMLGLTLWWQRGPAGQWLLQQALQQSVLSSPTLTGLSWNLHQARLAGIRFGLASQTGDLTVALDDVACDYSINPPKINTVSIAHAALGFRYRLGAQAAATDETGSELMSLPLEKLSIAKLDIDIDTPWGLSQFAGRGEMARAADQSLLAAFQDTGQSIQLTVDAGFSSARLIVERAPGGQVLELQAQQLDQAHRQIQLTATALPLIEWLSTSSLVPQTWRGQLNAAKLTQIKPGLSGMQLAVQATSEDGLNAAQGQASLTRDKHTLLFFDVAKANSQMLTADGHLALAATEAFALLQPWLPETSAGWTVAGGTLQGGAKLHWQTQTGKTGTAQLNIADLALTAGAARIENGRFSLQIPDLAEATMHLAADVPTLGLGKDLLAHNFKVNARYLDQQLTLDQASLALLGGTLEWLPASIRLDQPPFLLTLRVTGVDLSQLLASLHYPHLAGTGTIDGELPLQLSAGAIALQDGNLIGMRPGVLRYVGPVADQENIAFKALRNLVYQTLQARVNYRPNGDYLLGLRVEGHNPEVLSGHPLAFKLNISGQLPELLQKGILAGDFERAILEQATAKPASPEKPLSAPAGDQASKPPPADRRSQ